MACVRWAGARPRSFFALSFVRVLSILEHNIRGDERRLWSKGASTQAACGALLTRIVQWRPVCTRFLVLLGMVLLLGVVSASGGGDPGGGDYYSNWRVHITERSAGAGSVCTIAVQLYDGDTQHDTSEFATQSSASGAYNGARPSANYGSQNPWNSANTLDWCSEKDTGTQDSYVQYHFHSAVKVTKYKLAPPKTSNDCTRAYA